MYCNNNRDRLRFANSQNDFKELLAYSNFDRKLEKL